MLLMIVFDQNSSKICTTCVMHANQCVTIVHEIYALKTTNAIWPIGRKKKDKKKDKKKKKKDN